MRHRVSLRSSTFCCTRSLPSSLLIQVTRLSGQHLRGSLYSSRCSSPQLTQIVTSAGFLGLAISRFLVANVRTDVYTDVRTDASANVRTDIRTDARTDTTGTTGHDQENANRSGNRAEQQPALSVRDEPALHGPGAAHHHGSGRGCGAIQEPG